MTEARLTKAETYVSSRVSSRDRWLLTTRRPRFESTDCGNSAESDVVSEMADTNMNPEWLAIARQSHEALRAALRVLTPEERLMIRWRFERGLTLARLAAIFGLRDVQTADRRIGDLLRRLREELERASGAKSQGPVRRSWPQGGLTAGAARRIVQDLQRRAHPPSWLRTRIVMFERHWKVDYGRVFDILPDGLEDLRAFSRALARLA